MSNSARFAIITPYYKEPREMLERCLKSVKRQTMAADHFFISDGFPQDWLDDVCSKHLKLGHAYRDSGNTPRGIGALLAVSERYNGIGLLDADNWYDDDHVEACVTAAASVHGETADLVFGRRRMMRIDGTPTDFPEEPGHVDTSCYWFLEGSFHLLHFWVTMPVELAPICDRIFYRMIRSRNLAVHHARKLTVNFTYRYENLYRALGENIPPGVKPVVDSQPIFEWLRGLSASQRRIVAYRCGFDPLSMLGQTITEPQ
jgi:glycosyltransferase involved in cell wall biosynthesis